MCDITHSYLIPIDPTAFLPLQAREIKERKGKGGGGGGGETERAKERKGERGK